MSAIIEIEHLRKALAKRSIKRYQYERQQRRSCHHYRFFLVLVNQRYYVVLIC